MNSLQLVILAILATQSLQQASKQTENDIINSIVFDLADLTIDYETDHGAFTIEAFKSSLNDPIIDKQQVSKYGRLNWFSIGSPALVLTPDQLNQTIKHLFTFNPEGFYVRAEMLTHEHRVLLQQLVLEKYHINVTGRQIVNLVPSKFDCAISFYDDGTKFLINGKVLQLNKTPLRIDFHAPLKTNERAAFEKRVKNFGKDLDLSIVCEIATKGKRVKANKVKANTLTLTGEQLQQLGVIDEIFGVSNHTFRYVTREQISAISSKLYNDLNILEDYQIPESQFKETFISDFVKLAADESFKSVKFEDALESLSKFNVEQDLKGAELKEDLGKLLTINIADSKETLQVNRDHLTLIKNRSESDFLTEITEIVANFVTDKASEWRNSAKTLQQQIDELNKLSENLIEWSRKGNCVTPKSLKVAKLTRAIATKKLIFQRIKKVFENAAFKKQISFNTLINIINKDKQIDEMTLTIRDLNESCDEMKAKADNALKQYNEIKHQSQAILSFFSTESHMLEPREVMKLYELSEFPLNFRLKLLYRASRDGFNATVFHQKCDNHKNTVTIFKSSTGFVFGGYSSQTWNGCHEKKDSEAFLFSLKRNVPGFNVHTDAQRLNVKLGNNAIIPCTDLGPDFNEISTGFDSNFADYYSNIGNHYQLPKGFTAQSLEASAYLVGACSHTVGYRCDFSVSEIEVFWVENK